MSGTKIKKIEELKGIVKNLKAKGRKVVFTNGCFDILHYGHVMYLKKAKAKGDVLIVAINSDNSIKRIKGAGRPIIKEQDRLKIIASLENVDYVVLFNENTPLKTIQKLKPDVLVKGADWNQNNIVGADFIKGYGGKVATVKLAKGRSTSNLIKKIIESYKS